MTRRDHHDQRQPEVAHDRSNPPETARELAFAVLREFEASGAFLALTLEQLDRGRLAPSDRGLAVELSHGVVRRRATLDAVLRRVVDRPQDSVEPDLWTILRLGALQLLLVPGLPPHAAVHETVELTKTIGMPRWAGMVNGVLRAISRITTEVILTSPAAAGLPIIEMRPAPAGSESAAIEIVYRRLNRDAFPAPEFDLPAYIADAFSVPRWLIERMSAGLDGAELLRRAAWFTTAGTLTLRVNPRRTERETLLEALREQGLDAWQGALPHSVRMAQSTRIDALPGFRDGWFSVQDESAMTVSALLDPQPGESVLDLCSAPGGKATHLAELMGNEGRVVACDIGTKRTGLIEQSARRLGLSAIETRAIEPDGLNVPDGPFDAALVDAPCSNTGVLGKRPEVRWRLSEADFAELPDLQLRVLATAASRVRSGGRLVYSTCSVDRQENEGVVQRFLDSSSGWELADERRSIPGQPGDGGYAALLRRS